LIAFKILHHYQFKVDCVLWICVAYIEYNGPEKGELVHAHTVHVWNSVVLKAVQN